MAVNDGYSRNPIPLQGPMGRVSSNLASGMGAPQQSDTKGNFTPNTPKGAAQDFVRNPVPLEGDLGASEEGAKKQGPDWLQVSRENFMVSQNWFDISVRRRMEENLAHTYSRHAGGSKYYSPDYDKRSKYFRPKTRIMLRKQEAACALAYFSTMEVVNCEPQDESDPAQTLAAKVHTQLLNYRLKKTVPWFKTCLGGWFDAMVAGTVISCQEWRYQESKIVEDEFDPEGNPTGKTRETAKVRRDTPWIRLIPVENLRLHPSCDWVDPINSSPYLIEQIPWFVEELADHIKNARSYGSQVPYLREFTVEELMAGATDINNTAQVVRQARENVRLDRYSQVQQGQNNRIVWVHRNIMRRDGLDYVFETLGTTIQLSDPVPIEDVFGLDYRPYVMGNCTVETHRPYPSGPVEISSDTQKLMNDVQNQRQDNLRLALNNRYLVKRGQMVDMRSLMRNVPGAITMTTDPEHDVKQLETKDVTQSAYKEQDLLDLDFGDLTGVLNQATVGALTGGSRDQRVRNTELLGQGADIITELGLRTFNETWAQPVLAQIVDLERQFETDDKILKIAGTRAVPNLKWQDAFRSMAEPTNMNVAVGFGNTDPLQRIQRFAIGFQTIGQISPEAAQGADPNAVIREVMGILGYQDGSKFFPGVKDDGSNPQVKQLQKQVQDLQAQLQQDAQKYQSMEKIAQIRADSAKAIADIKSQTQTSIAAGNQAAKHYVAQLQFQIKQLNEQIDREGNVIKQGELLLEREALSNAIVQADREFQLKLATMQNPVLPEIPAGAGADEPFISGLRTPGSASALNSEPGEMPVMPGADDGGAGVISCGNYGKIPEAVG